MRTLLLGVGHGVQRWLGRNGLRVAGSAGVLVMAIVVLQLQAPSAFRLLLSPASYAQGPIEPTDIAIGDFFFTPQSITVSRTSSLRWTNMGQVFHTVTSPGIGNALIPPGGTYEFTFVNAVPGTYSYFCGLHPSMTGTITIADQNQDPTATPTTTPTTSPTTGQPTEAAVYLPVAVKAHPPTPTTHPPTPTLTTPSVPPTLTPTGGPGSGLVQRVDIGITTTSGANCQVANPLSAPVVIPAGSKSIAYQVAVQVPEASRVNIFIEPSLGGGGITGTSCNGYVVIDGTLRQNVYGAEIHRLDDQPLPAGNYALVIVVNGVRQEVPFRVARP